MLENFTFVIEAFTTAFESFHFAFIVWGVALSSGVYSLSSFRSHTPVNLLRRGGRMVKPEDITDIPAYNRANGIMWAIYATFMALWGVLIFFSMWNAMVLFILIIPSPFVLMIVYRRIYSKYRRK